MIYISYFNYPLTLHTKRLFVISFSRTIAVVSRVTRDDVMMTMRSWLEIFHAAFWCCIHVTLLGETWQVINSLVAARGEVRI